MSRIEGVFRQKTSGGVTIYRQKNKAEVFRVDLDGQYEQCGKFSFDASRYGGSQAFMKRMLKRGYQNCRVRQKKKVRGRKGT